MTTKSARPTPGAQRRSHTLTEADLVAVGQALGAKVAQSAPASPSGSPTATPHRTPAPAPEATPGDLPKPLHTMDHAELRAVEIEASSAMFGHLDR